MEKLQRYLNQMQCVGCGGTLQIVEGTLSCIQCGENFAVSNGAPFLIDSADRAGQKLSGHMEALFRFPAFYRIKIQLLLRLNRTNDVSLTELLRGKSILDVGCGPFIYGYDATLPAGLVGIDLSPQFVHAMSRHDPKNLFMVANARKIPFVSKSFDVSFLRYVIHHIPGDTATLLTEVARVTRDYLVIFDHVRSDVSWKEAIQTTYWKMFDSGHHYNTRREWDELLRPYRVAAFQRTGRMFGNICQIILDLRGHG
jgi:SAM-dependent methyltransferase